MKHLLLLLTFFLASQAFAENAKTQDYVLKFKTFNKDLIEFYKHNYPVKRYFSLPDETLFELKKSGEKSGQKLADLRTYFRVKADKELYHKLKQDKNIHLMYKDIKNIPRPVISVDIAPQTANWVEEQGYLFPFSSHGGLNPKYAWNFDGGKGENVTVVDIEGGWTHDHEDLGIEDPNLYKEDGTNLTGTPVGGGHPMFVNHGTAVLGQIGSIDNDYGVTGMANKATLRVINDYSNEYGYSTADAIIRGVSVLEVGSVILLESQKGGPRYNPTDENPDTQFGLVPDEWLQAEFDAIKTATANGFIIVEAGANGEQNLDDPIYHTCTGDINTYFTDKSGKEPCFDLATRDSGAILVGAGNPPGNEHGIPRAKMYYTSFGKRVDVQAWGADIYTTGYGDLFFPNNDAKQAYTVSFGGTSGASPMITSVAALVQSRYKALNNNQTLTCQQIRDIIKDPQHSNPQAGNPETEHIGPQPDVELIFKRYFHDQAYDCDPACEAWQVCTPEGTCALKENRCETNANCASHEICDDSHHCIDPCKDVTCNNWEFCKLGECVVKEDKCDNNSFCSDKESCDLLTHECMDPCSSLTCPTHASCERQNENKTALCVCEAGYGMTHEGVCKKFETPTPPKKDTSSCSYSSSTNHSWSVFILLILSLLFFQRKKLNTK